MDELRTKHRKEAKDLQSRITQKKKAATKKTRKGVNDECDGLERQLQERHQQEVAAINGEGDGEEGDEDVAAGVATLDIDDGQTQPRPRPQPSSSEPSLPAPSPSDPPSETGPKKKPNRAKARLARRAAEQEALAASASEEAQDLPDLKARERERMLQEFGTRGLQEKEIRADGHCLYSAVADQMQQLSMPLGQAPPDKPHVATALEPYRQVRNAAADYIENHPDDFAPFLEEPLAYYVHKVRNTGEWGGQLELLALAKTYDINISVLQGDGRVEKIQPDQNDSQDKVIWLAYYRHGFGLGEHYNSLRKATV